MKTIQQIEDDYNQALNQAKNDYGNAMTITDLDKQEEK